MSAKPKRVTETGPFEGPWVLSEDTLARIKAVLEMAEGGELTVHGVAVRLRDLLATKTRPEQVPALAKALRAEGWTPARRYGLDEHQRRLIRGGARRP